MKLNSELTFCVKTLPYIKMTRIKALQYCSEMHAFLVHIMFVENTYVLLNTSTYLTLRRLMSYIYGAPILDVSRSHTTTQHSR